MSPTVIFNKTAAPGRVCLKTTVISHFGQIIENNFNHIGVLNGCECCSTQIVTGVSPKNVLYLIGNSLFLIRGSFITLFGALLRNCPLCLVPYFKCLAHLPILSKGSFSGYETTSILDHSNQSVLNRVAGDAHWLERNACTRKNLFLQGNWMDVLLQVSNAFAYRSRSSLSERNFPKA